MNGIKIKLVTSSFIVPYVTYNVLTGQLTHSYLKKTIEPSLDLDKFHILILLYLVYSRYIQI